MTKFRFVGRIEFLGHSVPVDLWFDCSRADLVDALSGLVCFPDDPFWQPEELHALPPPLVGEGLGEGSRLRRPLASPHLFDDLYPGNDERNWLILAKRFPDLFRAEPDLTGPPPGGPPKNIADIERLRKQLNSPPLRGDGLGEGSTIAADLEILLAIPREQLLKADGSINASEVARRINRRTGGTDWNYVQEVTIALQEEWAAEDNDESNQWAVA